MMFFDLLSKKFAVGGHRGARSQAPENTMAAYESAAAQGADFIEIDVRPARDGQLVVFHDPTLERTTDVAARPEFSGRAPWRVEDFSWDEIRSLDAGSWFGPDAAFAGQRISSLAEVLRFCRERCFPVNVEIKDLGPDRPSPVPMMLEDIARTGSRELVLVSSFNPDYLVQAARMDPNLPRGLLAEPPMPEDPLALAVRVRAAAYHPDQSCLEPQDIAGFRAAGLHVIPWTVNDPQRAIRFFQAGAGAVITDHPGLLRRALDDLDRN